MLTTLQWQDVALRLGLTVLAGMLLGSDRSERGAVVGLGVSARALGVVILQALKPLELRLRRGRSGTLTVRAGPEGPADEEIRTVLSVAGYEVLSWDVVYDRRGEGLRRTVRCQVGWR